MRIDWASPIHNSLIPRTQRVGIAELSLERDRNIRFFFTSCQIFGHQLDPEALRFKPKLGIHLYLELGSGFHWQPNTIGKIIPAPGFHTETCPAQGRRVRSKPLHMIDVDHIYRAEWICATLRTTPGRNQGFSMLASGVSIGVNSVFGTRPATG